MYVYICIYRSWYVYTCTYASCLFVFVRSSVCVCDMVLIRHTLFFIPGSCHCQGCVDRDDGTTFLQLFDREIGQILRDFMPWAPWELGNPPSMDGDSAAGEAATKGWPFSIAAFDYSTAGEDLFPRVA